MLAGCTYPLHAQGEEVAKEPGEQLEEAARVLGVDAKPYHLPTYTGKAPPLNHKIAPYLHGPKLDMDHIYKRILGCYPAKSKWKIDVELRAAAGLGSDVTTDSSISSNYAQIVASMPIYSATELDRAVKNEHDLRQQTAGDVSTFITAINARNHALRKIALYTSLERRSSIRVQTGVAMSDEQVGYLEKVAKAHDDRNDAEAKIMASRLSLAAVCSTSKYNHINHYLKGVSDVPE